MVPSITVLFLLSGVCDAEEVATSLAGAGANIRVDHVGTVDEALARLRQGTVDCTLLEFGVGTEREADVLERLVDAAPDVPHLALVPEDAPAVLRAALDNGASDYVRPVDGTIEYRSLATRVENAVARARSSGEPATDRPGDAAGDGRPTLGQGFATYEAVMRAIPDEITIFDLEGTFVDVIPPTGQEVTLTGHRPSELRGESIGVATPDEDVGRAWEHLHELATTERDQATFEMEIVAGDGEILLRENHMALLEDEAGEPIGCVNVLRDISERKAYERLLQRQNERLEQFASIASHDLRNPLNLAQGYLELIDEDCDSPHTETVAEALDRMARLIDDTLAWTRGGADVDEPQPVSLGPVVVQSWAAVGGDAANLETAADLPVLADPDRLRRLFENVLRNAREHGGEDVSVEVGAIHADGESNADSRPIGFYVADDGPGIPPEEREDVFEMGYTTASDGTGFGLAIIGEICEAHGWNIAVTESETDGARFEVTGVDVGERDD